MPGPPPVDFPPSRPAVEGAKSTGGFFLASGEGRDDMGSVCLAETSTTWTSQREANRILGAGSSRLFRLCLLGRIRAMVAPAGHIAFNRHDLERVAREEQEGDQDA